MSAVPKIKLYVDTVSPFGYEAYWILRHDPVFSKCEIEYVPIFLGGVMKACGNPTPISIKNKGTWIGTERLRWAKAFNVPMKKDIPPNFPPMTLTIMRGMCALTLLHPGKEGQGMLIRCLDRLFEAYWVEHRRTFEKDVLAEVLTEVVGKEETEKILAMVPKEGKELLAKNSDLAFKDGAFGLPWFMATNSNGETEAFWGVDHLGQVAQHLGIEKPQMGGWKALL
ncbi:2-hydroxychromene-2-carboxylate isomerase-like protein [Mollisia scopiformis]|uniref:Glutathione S-transferase kappa n=1 Tax=Mollisia scopiformis TaxID=149040 RepID=A0A194XSJ2_MOLSC|nr:2-hydroxychromene-2-carboxylate isomerase-like protein [Mollisia scopiformis]KUJ23111.1 2-hydroxychromene-2-carboxylate isomeras-like protein [Mollisia scopiformis]